MARFREFRESPVSQGVDEEIVYTVTTTAWGSNPSSVVVKVFDVSVASAKTDVTATVMPTGTASATGDLIALPTLKALTVGHSYRIEVKFESEGNIFEAFGIVNAEE